MDDSQVRPRGANPDAFSALRPFFAPARKAAVQKPMTKLKRVFQGVP